MANKPLVSLQFPDLADTYTIPTKTSDLTNDSGFVTSVPSPASSGTPAMDGTASRGSSTEYARKDHVHPTDTSRLAANQGTTNAGKFMVVGSDGIVAPVTMQTWQGGSY